MDVRRIENKMAHPWIRKKHYARRLPPVKYAFALVDNEIIQGVVTYGPPASPQVAKSVAGEENRLIVIELNRLCIDTEIENAASILVGRSLRMLPAGLVVVSYADTKMGHVGYIYQATNWKYAGALKALAARGIKNILSWAKENGHEIISPSPKHRYVFLTGSKRDRKNLAKIIKWKILDKYPKGDHKARYDAGEKLSEAETSLAKPVDPQGELFG